MCIWSAHARTHAHMRTNTHTYKHSKADTPGNHHSCEKVEHDASLLLWTLRYSWCQRGPKAFLSAFNSSGSPMLSLTSCGALSVKKMTLPLRHWKASEIPQVKERVYAMTETASYQCTVCLIDKVMGRLGYVLGLHKGRQ